MRDPSLIVSVNSSTTRQFIINVVCVGVMTFIPTLAFQSRGLQGSVLCCVCFLGEPLGRQKRVDLVVGRVWQAL
jgi:hypothetical protein